MALVIEHDLAVAAPAERVWSVVCDLARYPEWNPFVVSCASTLAVGDPIFMRVRLVGFAQPQREQILEHDPGRRLCYGLAPSRFGALMSRRSHEVVALDPTHTRYVSHFALSGWLSPLVALLLGRRLRAGFTAMSTAIQARAEGLAREAEVEFEVGQRWRYRTRPQEPRSTLVIGRIDALSGVGPAIHVSVYDVNVRNPRVASGISSVVQHVPISPEALRSSVVEPCGTSAVDAGFVAGYETWRQAVDEPGSNAGAFSIPLCDVIEHIESILGARR